MTLAGEGAKATVDSGTTLTSLSSSSSANLLRRTAPMAGEAGAELESLSPSSVQEKKRSAPCVQNNDRCVPMGPQRPVASFGNPMETQRAGINTDQTQPVPNWGYPAVREGVDCIDWGIRSDDGQC